jgi:hypothetical protein
MPDLWGYQGYDLTPKPMSRMSLDHGHGHPYGLGRGGGQGQGMGDDGLASSAYLNSLLRPQPRRESMPIMLPSNYNMGGYSMGSGGGVSGQNGRGDQHQYRTPTPNAGLPNLFNGYQIGPSSSNGNATNTNGCTRDVPRSMTPASSTQMATPQGWELAGPTNVSHPTVDKWSIELSLKHSDLITNGNGFPINDTELPGTGSSTTASGTPWNLVCVIPLT